MKSSAVLFHLRVITVLRDIIYVIIILYSWHLVIWEHFWPDVWYNWSWVMHTMSTWFWHKNRVWHHPQGLQRRRRLLLSDGLPIAGPPPTGQQIPVVATVPRLDPSVAASLAAAPGGSGLTDDAAVVLRAAVEKEAVDAVAAKGHGRRGSGREGRSRQEKSWMWLRWRRL
jgi:hypothetical protein